MKTTNQADRINAEIQEWNAAWNDRGVMLDREEREAVAAKRAAIATRDAKVAS